MSAGRRFHFPLETVLKVRNLREEQARLEVAQAQKQLARSRQAQTETEGHISRVLDRVKGTTSQDWEAPDYQMIFSYLEHLKLALESWRERVAQEGKVVEEKTLALQRCHQERRLLERLRERKYAEYRRELTKFLENQTEAIVLARWSHT